MGGASRRRQTRRLARFWNGAPCTDHGSSKEAGRGADPCSRLHTPQGKFPNTASGTACSRGCTRLPFRSGLGSSSRRGAECPAFLSGVATTPQPALRANDTALLEMCSPSQCDSARMTLGCVGWLYHEPVLDAISAIMQLAARRWMQRGGTSSHALRGVRANDTLVHSRCKEGDTALLHALYGPLPARFYESAPKDTGRFLVLAPPNSRSSAICKACATAMEAGLRRACPRAEIKHMDGTPEIDFVRMTLHPRVMIGSSTFSLAAAVGNSGDVWTPLQHEHVLLLARLMRREQATSPACFSWACRTSNPPTPLSLNETRARWAYTVGHSLPKRWHVVGTFHLPGKRAARTELGLRCDPPETPKGKACADADGPAKALAWLLSH